MKERSFAEALALLCARLHLCPSRSHGQRAQAPDESRLTFPKIAWHSRHVIFAFVLVVSGLTILLGTDVARAQTSSACNGHGTLNTLGQCVCDVGFTGASCGQCAESFFQYPTCRFCNSAETCGGHGSCGATGFCQCSAPFTGAACDACLAGFYGPSCLPCPGGST